METISEKDESTTNSIGQNVYVSTYSKKDFKDFEYLFEIKNIIKGFLNFVICKENILGKTVYGIRVLDNEQQLFPIGYKSRLIDEMDNLE
jgi:hypothetical protein